MKKIISTIIFSCFKFCYARRGSSERAIDLLGIAKQDEVVKSLKISIILILIGLIVIYFTVWNKKDVDKIDNLNLTFGYQGKIMVGIGLIFLIPLWTWIEYWLIYIFSYGFIILIIIVVLILLYNFFKS